MDQIVAQREEICRRKGLDLVVFAVANSKRLLLTKEGIQGTWRQSVAEAPLATDGVREIIDYARRSASKILSWSTTPPPLPSPIDIAK